MLSREAGQSQGRLRFALRVLQFLPDTQSLRVTPAMEAGITGHIWSLRELLG
jgi:hypothetical protein